MSKLWTAIRDKRNREILWLAGGLAGDSARFADTDA
jgi:hypothetical protein